MKSARPARLGIVIPTLNEEVCLPPLLRDLEALSPPVEIVVSDGGSVDRTLEVARSGGATVVAGPRGRGRQMNVGASYLATPWILFLHADSRVPPGTRAALTDWLCSPHPSEAAHFAFRLNQRGLWWTLIERGQRVRERLTGLAYGDQGLLLSRARYQALGGFPEQSLMEDVEIVKRLRREGGLDRIEAPIVTSHRRYAAEGPFLGWLRNASLITLYSLGVSPAWLSRWYRPRTAIPPTRPQMN